jgi:hypothetical protein
MKQFNTILGILEFHEKGLTYKQTQERFHVGASTVNSVLEKYEALGIPLEDLKSRSAEAVEELFYPEAKTRRKAIPLPDFQRAYDRIHAKGSRANIVFCWMEYITENPEGYRLTQYTEHYNRYVERNFGKRTSMGVERIPGQNLYIDWVGDQPELPCRLPDGRNQEGAYLQRPQWHSAVMFTHRHSPTRSRTILSQASSTPSGFMEECRNIWFQTT